MPDPTVFDPHSVEHMTGEPERWHETTWDSIVHRFEGATREQLMALTQGGIGEPTSEGSV